MHIRIWQKLAYTLIICLLSILMNSCDQQESPPPPTKAQRPNQDQEPVLTIGLIPERDVFEQKKRYQPLADYISAHIGITVENHILSRYGNIVENFNDLHLEGAFFGSFTGALAIEKLYVEPLARPEYTDGTSTYYGMVFVRKDSHIKTPQDLRGKRMVFVDRATTAGYLLPLSFFKALGIEDYRSWFGEYYFSGTHEGAINDVLNGNADIGAAKNTVFYRMAEKDRRITEELQILQTSPHVPANGLAVKHGLPVKLKEALKQTLLTMHQHDSGREILNEMGIRKFIETSREDYNPVFEYAKSIGIDLKNYNYSNN